MSDKELSIEAHGLGGVDVSGQQYAIDRIRRRLETLERAGPPLLGDRCAALSELETETIGLLAARDDGDDRTLGLGAVLGWLRHWRMLCERNQLEEPAAECSRLSADAMQEAAGDWHDRVSEESQTADGEDLFHHLMRTRQFLFDIESREDAGSRTERPIEELRNALRERMQTRLADEQPTSGQLDRWGERIVDQCAAILTAIDELPPSRAVVQLELAIDAATWHLKQVDKRKCRATSRIRAKLRRLRAELEERRLSVRLESIFGRRFVGFFERLVLVLIVLVVALMAIEWTVTLPARTLFWFNVVDAAACSVFLLEFFVKLSLVPGRRNWFRRHFLIDLVPSIPVGMLSIGLGQADFLRAGRLARFIRISRLIRYVRVLRPVVQAVRAFGLMARGLDRLVRGNSHILNCNVVLYPTAAETQQYLSRLQREDVELQTLQQRILHAWGTFLTEADDDTERETVCTARVAELSKMCEQKLIRFDEGASSASGVSDIPAQALLDQMESLEPALVQPLLGDELTAQLAGVVRRLATAPFKWFPIIRGLVPGNAGRLDDVTAVAEAARRTASYSRKFYDLWFWISDLYGTVTPSQFIDRVGALLVKSSSRPAYRLALFGSFLLLTEAVFHIAALDALATVRQFLQRFVGTTVMVVGGICIVVLSVGWWLQRVAREATEFYEKSVLGQFLLLTDSIRAERLDRDAALLFDRALMPDWPDRHVAASDDQASDAISVPDDSAEEHAQWRSERVAELAELLRNSMTHTRSESAATEFPFLDRLALMYRDWLDGAMFTQTDTRATTQLLGNTALRQLLLTSHRITKKDMKAVSLVDLESQKSPFKGPYLWFQFISQSIAHSVACLLVEYNRKAVPLDELEHCSDEQMSAYTAWLGTTTTTETDTTNPSEEEARYVTTAFTALHFLDPDEWREAEVESRFGPAVLQRLKRDRGLMIRRTFGTFPMHLRPRGERVVNLFAIYEGWIAGGRVFFLPVFLLIAGMKGLGRLIGWIYHAAQDIRYPERRAVRIDAAQADFTVAMRKINRIRGPVASECARLRAKLDPAWLGTPLPGEHETLLGGADASTDLQFLQLGPALERDIQTERIRSEDNMRLLAHALTDGVMERTATQRGLPSSAFSSRAHLRAAAIAVHADLLGVRSRLFALPLMREVFGTTQSRPRWRDRFRLRFKLRSAFRKYWSAHGTDDQKARRTAWRATLKNENGVEDALLAWAQHGDEVVAMGEKLLGDVLSHPGRITEQLLALRTIQTFTVLDVLHYREQIRELGEYDV